MNKIKEKLTGHSSSSNNTEDSRKLEKSYNSSSGTGSSLQHPISSSSPTGTAVGSGATSSSGIGRDEYSSGYGSQNAPGAGGGYPTQSSVTGSTGHPTHHPSTTGGLPSHSTTTNTTTTSSGYGNQPSGTSRYFNETSPTTHTTHSSQPPGAYQGSTSNAPGSGGLMSDDRSGGYGAPQRDTSGGYGRSQYEDPNIARGTSGGVLDQRGGPTGGGYSSGAPRTTEQQQFGNIRDPHTSGTTSGSGHHYGRDAALAAGGAGAIGGASYEYGQHSGRNEPSMTSQQYPNERPNYDIGSDQHRGLGHDASGRHEPSGIQYMNRDTHGGQGSHSSPIGGAGGMGGNMLGGGESQVPDSKKVSSAYESGYRDAMEHMKAEGYHK